MRGYTGGEFNIVFTGVTSCHAIAPEGMTLYALVELQHAAPYRKFWFANWDQDDTSQLTVIAEGFHVKDDS